MQISGENWSLNRMQNCTNAIRWTVLGGHSGIIKRDVSSLKISFRYLDSKMQANRKNYTIKYLLGIALGKWIVSQLCKHFKNI